MPAKAVHAAAPPRRSRNLAQELVEHLGDRIRDGRLVPGEKLPTEAALMTAQGVSRTVVREALATLRAKGLITTRQGLGAFVANDPNPRSFSIVPNDLESIDEVISVLELRLQTFRAAGDVSIHANDGHVRKVPL